MDKKPRSNKRKPQQADSELEANTKSKKNSKSSEKPKKPAKQEKEKIEKKSKTPQKKAGKTKEKNEVVQNSEPKPITTAKEIKEVSANKTDKKSSSQKGTKEIKLYSWNVNGLRAVQDRGDLDSFVKRENPDIFCLNETKIDLKKLEQLKLNQLYSEHFSSHWVCSEKPGYAGVAIFTKIKPISVSNGIGIEKHDGEGIKLMKHRKSNYSRIRFFLFSRSLYSQCWGRIEETRLQNKRMGR